MKKNAKRFLLLLIVCLLVWTVFPRPFAWIIPQRMVNYFQEGCSSTGDCQTTLLWDGTTLWVNWLGGHYLGYRPTDPAGFEAAIQRLALEYGGTAIVTS